MDPEQIYQQLIELAEKLQIRVSEKNLRQPGLRVRSGLCKVHGQSIYMMDKKARITRKVDLLAECLSQQSLDELYVVPAVREVIEKNRPENPAREPADDPSDESETASIVETEVPDSDAPDLDAPDPEKGQEETEAPPG